MKRVVTKVYTFQELLDLYEKKKIKESALDNARNWLKEVNTSDSWYESVYEQWKSALESIGMIDPDISFSGFWSQGDGASFVCKWIDKELLIKFLASDTDKCERIEVDPDGKEQFWPWIVHMANGYHRNPNFTKLLHVLDYIEIGIVRGSGNYVHENSCSVEFEFRDDGEWVSEKEPNRPYWASDSKWKSKYPKLRKLADDFNESVSQLRLDLSKAIYKHLEEEYEYRCEDEQLKELAEANEYTFTISGERFG